MNENSWKRPRRGKALVQGHAAGLEGCCFSEDLLCAWPRGGGETKLFIFFNIIYLLLDRREGKEKERERNITVWLPLVHCPPPAHLGPGL